MWLVYYIYELIKMSEWMYKFCCVSVAVLFNHSVRFVFWLKYITKCSCYHHTDTVLFEAYCVSRVLSLWIACKSTWHCHSLSSHFIFVCLCDEQTYLCRKIWIAPPPSGYAYEVHSTVYCMFYCCFPSHCCYFHVISWPNTVDTTNVFGDFGHGTTWK